MKPDPTLPLVYACSGCSSAAQLANHFALRLTRAGHAEMSCIAGVGGQVPTLLRLARSGRRILALDGCPLRCVQGCLKQAGVQADLSIELSDHGVIKRKHADFNNADAERLWPQLVAAAQSLQPPCEPHDPQAAPLTAASATDRTPRNR
ncbi:putative zinc-binding protein [Vogesella sp. LYT5W]|uniref:Zinc-binding protein n=1 Tax=Vogesella margarita TaxID=2984199 RepID=A0ABT5IL80_9NEIS|nr:putative zinc-binding protein [Vogesella margarita]MDC7713320.1 putative zinc-binding protein [Vogesella margarita]